MPKLIASTPPPSRWFRFSLRTLFVVVTVFGVFFGWVVYQLNWIRERHDARVRWDFSYSEAGHPNRTPPPWSLRLFGEKQFLADFVVLQIPENDPIFRHIQKLFPEVRFYGPQQLTPVRLPNSRANP